MKFACYTCFVASEYNAHNFSKFCIVTRVVIIIYSVSLQRLLKVNLGVK